MSIEFQNRTATHHLETAIQTFDNVGDVNQTEGENRQTKANSASELASPCTENQRSALCNALAILLNKESQDKNKELQNTSVFNPAALKKNYSTLSHDCPQPQSMTLAQEVGVIIEDIGKGNYTLNKYMSRAMPSVFIDDDGISQIDKEKLTKPCKSELYLCYNVYLDHVLELYGLTEDNYKLLNTPSNTEFAPDPVIALMKEEKISSRLTEMQQDFARIGYEKFTCPELAVVLINLTKSIDDTLHELDSAECNSMLTFYLKGLRLEAQQLKDKGKEIPYSNTVCLCFKFTFIQSLIDLLHFPESYFSKIQQREIHTDIDMFTNNKPTESQLCELIKKVFGKPLDQLLTVITQLGMEISIYAYSTQTHSPIPSNIYFRGWVKNKSKELVWPTFSSLDLDFFNKASRYSIHLAGITTQKLCFHDTLIMQKHCLFTHDFFHADKKGITERQIAGIAKSLGRHPLAEEQQTYYDGVQHALAQLNITDKILLESVKLAFFSASHEQGLRRFNFMSKEGCLMPAYSLEELQRVLFQNIASYDSLDKNMTLEHIQQAVFLLNVIAYSRIVPEDFPELQFPSKTERISSQASRSVRYA